MQHGFHCFRAWLGIASWLVILGIASGCAQNSQFAKIQAEKQQLTARVAQEKERANELASALDSERRRAAEAERELALLHDGGAKSQTQYASAKSAAPQSISFEAWARTQSGLKFDTVRKVARIPLDLNFTADDRVPFQSRRELDKVADLLLTPEAANYGARVWSDESLAGDTHSIQRVNTITDYLRQRGIAHQRLETSSRKTPTLTDEEGRRTSSTAGRIEIELFELPASGRARVADEPRENGWTTKQRR